MQAPINIFIIYAREDKEIKQRLLLHLNLLKKVFNAVIWHDEHLEAGQEWRPHIESRLEQTDLFLLLVSVDFMNSEFINQVEFKYAIDRHKTNKSIVIPVIINYCQWDIDIYFKEYKFNLNELQVLPDEAKPIGDWKTPEQAYNNIAVGIRTVLSTIKKNREEEDKQEETSRKEIEEEQRKKNIKEKEKQETEKQTKEDEIEKKTSAIITEFEKNETQKQKKQNEKSLWEEAYELNTISSYQKYLSNTGSGEHKEEALQSVKNLEARAAIPEQKQEKPYATEKPKPGMIQKRYILISTGIVLLAVAAWFVIKMSSSANNPKDTGIQQASKTTPEGNDTTVNQQKTDSLLSQQLLMDNIREDDDSWKAALNKNTIGAFQDYKKNHPDGKHVNEALRNISVLVTQQNSDKQKRSDDLAWKTAVHANTIEAYKDYEARYPKGNYVMQALANREALQDELAWNAAMSENTIAAFQNYGKRYPKGNHFKQAQANIEDDLAWNDAARANIVSAYQKYQNSYPKGRHLIEASRSIKQLASKSQLTIGLHYGGGIIFYMDKAGEHGLIAAEEDISGTYKWNEATEVCKKYRGGGYADWRLPTIEELDQLYKERKSVGGLISLYWSSTGYIDTKYNEERAWYLDFNDGHQGTAHKYPKADQKRTDFFVRVIRNF